MDLLNSAKIFLIESLDNYNSRGKMAFSILHGMIALELLLKERLHRINPNLIYRNIDADYNPKPNSRNDKRRLTVEMSALPLRLKNLGMQLKQDEIKLINDIAEWRNNIAHHVPVHDDKEATLELGRLYNFIFTFLVNKLNENFHDFLPKEYYTRMQKIINELNRAVTEAKKKAEDSKNSDNQYPCSICNIIGVVEIKDKEHAYCHLCMKDLRMAICAHCEKPFHAYSSDRAYEECCNNCMEAARDQYIQHLIDLERGK